MPRRSKKRDDYTGPPGYLQKSQRPLQALVMLLPLVIAYELGVLIYATDYSQADARQQHILARSFLHDILQGIGIGGYFFPGIAVVAFLFGWHLVRKDPWEWRPPMYAAMLGESFVYALPLFVFMLVIIRHPEMGSPGTPAPADQPTAVSSAAPPGAVSVPGGAAPIARQAVDTSTAAPGAPSTSSQPADANRWQKEMVFSIGAGIYEELLFRLIGIALLHTIFVNLLALPDEWGTAAAVGISAFAFAVYHFANQPFDLKLFFFYAFCGVYLAAIYVVRGFGIVVLTHAIYDMLVVVFRMTHQ